MKRSPTSLSSPVADGDVEAQGSGQLLVCDREHARRGVGTELKDEAAGDWGESFVSFWMRAGRDDVVLEFPLLCHLESSSCDQNAARLTCSNQVCSNQGR